MGLKTCVKVGNISNLSDARYAAGMGVEMIGFVMDKISADYTSPEKMREIKSWVAGVQVVGETQSADYEEIKSFLDDYDIDLLQISEIELLPKITNLGKPIILKLEFESTDRLSEYLEKYSEFVAFFLLSGGEFSEFTQQKLQRYSSNYPIILDFGITSENINRVLEEIPIKGIALKGSSEIRPGYKNYDELSEILEILEQD